MNNRLVVIVYQLKKAPDIRSFKGIILNKIFDQLVRNSFYFDR